MKARTKLYSIIFCAGILPLCAAAAAYAAGLGPLPAAGAGVLAALAASLGASRLAGRGLLLPMERTAAGVRGFVAAGYRLEKAMPKEGWPEGRELISAANRLLLELGAFRAFQINQVIEERGKAQALIETIPDGVLLTGDSGRVIACNGAALELLGIPKLQGDTALPGSVAAAAFAAPMAALMASSEERTRTEVALPGPGGARTVLILSAQFTLTTLKKPGRVIVLRDITTEKELENTKETFFQMITHDMRAPLFSILGYMQVLKKNVAATPENENCMETITRAAGRLNGMIGDILTSTRLERGDLSLQPADLDAAELLERVRASLAPEAAKRKLSLFVSKPAAPVPLRGDQALLERVVTNLLGNALKFTPAGGGIELSCAAAEGGARFAVTDTGPGIPADKLRTVFEKYAQLEEHKNLGFGLGLAMCKMAVELHKGRIWVESEPGKGSRFIFVIPGAAA